MSSIVNKVKDALHSDKDKQSHPHDTTGTHSSRLNEPRVDAERDNRTSALNSGATGNTAYSRSDNYATGPASNTAGPHSSNLANKADPRVDSDLDSRNRVGGIGGATSGYATGPASNTAGPHSSNIANKADPRAGLRPGQLQPSWWCRWCHFWLRYRTCLEHCRPSLL
ncbi:hypothetical protein NLG97_g3122 [Lecanicillium saksenae]|uniref:Uncharacterized protein n=1 Tax=Lecanicillium saksenae TaxID=468837 RepID=A0ACC1R2C7_9HYPO|nr:hypothetical protein NLG97_g3122 [Lecanicillium saksenae]